MKEHISHIQKKFCQIKRLIMDVYVTIKWKVKRPKLFNECLDNTFTLLFLLLIKKIAIMRIRILQSFPKSCKYYYPQLRDEKSQNKEIKEY